MVVAGGPGSMVSERIEKTLSKYTAVNDKRAYDKERQIGNLLIAGSGGIVAGPGGKSGSTRNGGLYSISQGGSVNSINHVQRIYNTSAKNNGGGSSGLGSKQQLQQQ